MLERINRYEILDWIAAGGQGTVYRASDSVVALKVINQNIKDDPAYLEAVLNVLLKLFFFPFKPLLKTKHDRLMFQQLFFVYY